MKMKEKSLLETPILWRACRWSTSFTNLANSAKWIDIRLRRTDIALQIPFHMDRISNSMLNKRYLSYAGEVAGVCGKLSLQGSDGICQTTDQGARCAVNSGMIDELDTIDPDRRRQQPLFAVRLTRLRTLRGLGLLVDYDLSLFSYFTYFLDDPVRGDQLEQTDDRTIFGARIGGAIHRRLAGRPVTSSPKSGCTAPRSGCATTSSAKMRWRSCPSPPGARHRSP